MASFTLIVGIVLASVFALVGLYKLLFPMKVIERKLQWVKFFSKRTIRLVGLAEIIGSTGLILSAATGLYPWMAALASAWLAVIMTGAVMTHLHRKEYKDSIPAFTLLALSLVLILITYGSALAVIMPRSATVLLISYIALGSLGLLTSTYIYIKKSRKKPLVCNFAGHDCDKVVNSKYGKTFGMDNTILGGVYYAGIALYGLLALIFPVIMSLSPLVFWGSAGAALFSLWLLYAQAFILKDWCQYCLLSAGITIVIFLLSLVL